MRINGNELSFIAHLLSGRHVPITPMIFNKKAQLTLANPRDAKTYNKKAVLSQI